MDLVTLLLQVGIPAPIEVFDCAVRSQNIAMITELFDHCVEHRKLYKGQYYSGNLSRSTEDLEYRVIMTAIDCGNEDVLTAVLDCVDIRKIGASGDILKAGVLQDNPAIVERLLQSGIDPNSPLSMNPDQELQETPLVAAIRRRNMPIITLLLNENASLNPKINDFVSDPDFYPTKRWRCISPLSAAVTYLDTHLIEDLLRRGAEPCDSTAILMLSKAQSWASLDHLLSMAEGRCLDVKTSLLWHALVAAVDCTNFDLLRRLLPHVDQHLLFETNLDEHTRDHILSQWSESFRGRYQNRRLSILCFAMDRYVKNHCQRDMIGFLLNSDRDTRRACFEHYQRDGLGRGITRAYDPLQTAVLMRSTDCVDVLIEFGADIHRKATNSTQYTALQIAVEIGDVGMVTYLLGKGAWVNAPPAPLKGSTALQLAAERGFYRIAEILIDAKADVDAPRAKVGGRTAFEAATENGRLDMMGLLVKNGALSIDMELQYERAVKFAKAQCQDPAAEYAGQLRDKILEARRAAEEEFRELLDVPLIGFET